jgi:hypothetical protein
VKPAESGSIFQRLHRLGERLLIRLHIPPERVVAPMPGGLAGLVDALGLGELV